MSIGLLVESVKSLNDAIVIKAILPNSIVIDISTQQYVVDGEYYMFAKTDKYEYYKTQHTVGILKSNLEYEASDSCWRTNGDIFDDAKSDFFNCDIYIVTGDYDAFNDCMGDGYKCYDVYGFKVENDVMYLVCDVDALEETSVVTEDKSMEGHWITKVKDCHDMTYCSECKKEAIHKTQSNYCPHCGIKMSGKA